MTYYVSSGTLNLTKPQTSELCPAVTRMSHESLIPETEMFRNK